MHRRSVPLRILTALWVPSFRREPPAADIVLCFQLPSFLEQTSTSVEHSLENQLPGKLFSVFPCVSETRETPSLVEHPFSPRDRAIKPLRRFLIGSADWTIPA